MASVLIVIDLPGATTLGELEREGFALANKLGGQVTLMHPITETDCIDAVRNIGARLLKPLRRAMRSGVDADGTW